MVGRSDEEVRCRRLVPIMFSSCPTDRPMDVSMCRRAFELGQYV
jgi:hypothetical protein